MKRNGKLRWMPSGAALVLACACAAGISLSAQAQRLPTGTNELARADFEGVELIPDSGIMTTPTWDYGYWYSGPVEVVLDDPAMYYTRDRAYADPFLSAESGPTVFQYTFDSSPYNGAPCTQPGGWWGTGFGMPVPCINDPTAFNSMDPADYIVSLDARVEGLLPDQTTGPLNVQFRVGMGGGNWAICKTMALNAGSNWTHLVFTLDQGNWGGADSTPTTSMDTFTNGIVAGITELGINVGLDSPTQFGFDADNAVYMDNIRLQVLQYAGPPPPPPPKVALPVFDYNFDDKDIWWVWPDFSQGQTTTGWSANANTATYWGVRQADGINGTKGLAIAMDNSNIATDPPGIPAWAGGNVSAGGAVDYTVMTSPDLKDYRINLAAKAVGLQDGQTTPFIVQLYFNAPDGTLGATDGNSDTLLRLNMTVNGVSNDWKTFVVSLKDGTVDSGSLANFQTYLSKISEITFQLQIQNPHQAAIWGTDADNQITVDNFKLEHLVTGNPPLKVEVVSGKLVVSWDAPSTGTVKLLSAPAITGPWTEVTGANSPYTVPTPGAVSFFRTLWVAPTQ